MSQENIVENNGFLHIKELKERVKSLVSEVDLNRENTKFKHDKNVDFNLIDSTSTDENDDEFLDCSEIESRSETDWLLEEDNVGESVKDICNLIYSDLDENRPEVTYLFRQLESAQQPESYILSSQKPSIDSRTFTRPKKCSTRPPLTSVINSEEGRPKLQRRLTTTISPSPNLVSKLEELSKNNNRPISGNYNHGEWEGGSEESLAEIKTSISRTKRQSLPASLFDRLQELKKANSSIKIPNIVEQEPLNGQVVFEKERNHLLEDAKKVTEALDVNFKNSHSSRLSEIFRNTQDYYSDDNESFISLDEVSGFCDRLTLSTDQNTYSSIVREMEQNEICLFHRPLKGDKAKDSRMTFGGIETPPGNLSKNIIVNEEEADLNQKYEIDEELNYISNNTFDRNLGNFSKEHRRNATYDAHKKPGLVDVIVKNLSPNNNSVKSMNNNDTGSNYNNSNNNNNNNNNININNRVLARHCGSNLMNYTYQKPNNTLDQNALNALHGEKYSTKIFDSSFGKGESEPPKSVVRRSNGKRDQSDHSEDDCMSTTSDQSSRSVDSNSEPKLMGEIRNVAVQKRKILSSTPVTSQMAKINFDKFDVVSPIKTQMGDGESRAYSNPSSRGQSPRRGQPAAQREGIQKYRTPNLRQSLKVPQRELKLKPALIRPSQNFKRPLSYARTSSEPSVPQKVETFQPVASVPALRPLGPAAVPSLTNVRPSNRASGIPRPPTRLKQPQIRLENLQRK